MPPLMPVPGVLKVEFKGTVGSNNWANVQHFRWGGTSPDGTILNALAAFIETTWETTFQPLQDNRTALESVVVTDLTGPLAAQGVAETEHIGTATGDYLAAQVCGLTSYASALRFRGGHPRAYWCVGTFDELRDPSNWSGDFVTSLHDAAVALQAAVIGFSEGGFSVGVQCFVRYGPKNARIDPPVAYDILTGDVVASGRTATQRRRVGRHISHA